MEMLLLQTLLQLPASPQIPHTWKSSVFDTGGAPGARSQLYS